MVGFGCISLEPTQPDTVIAAANELRVLVAGLVLPPTLVCERWKTVADGDHTRRHRHDEQIREPSRIHPGQFRGGQRESPPHRKDQQRAAEPPGSLLSEERESERRTPDRKAGQEPEKDRTD